MRIARCNPENNWSHCPACNLEKKRRSYHRRDEEQPEDDGTKYCSCKPEPNAELDFDALIDWRGNEARLGDLIAYPVLNGRSAQLATGVLDRIYLKCGKYDSDWSTRLRVIPVDRSWWDLWRINRDTPLEERKPSTLQFWDRFILLEARGQ